MKRLAPLTILLAVAAAHATPSTLIGGGAGTANNNTGGVASLTSTISPSITSTIAPSFQVAPSYGGITTIVNPPAGDAAPASAAPAIGAGSVIGSPTTIYPRQTPTAVAPPAGGPPVGCRLFFGFGIGTPGASGSSGVPIGNDGYCVQGKSFELMNLINARDIAAGREPRFTEADYVRVACKTEGMSELEGCKGVPSLRIDQTAAGQGYLP